MMAVDWGIRKELVGFDGTDFYNFQKPEEIATDVVLLETGMPYMLLNRMNYDKLLVVSGQETNKKREELKVKKSDKNDAKIIYQLYVDNPELFRELEEKEEQLIRLQHAFKKFMILDKARTAQMNRKSALEREYDESPEVEEEISSIDEEIEYRKQEMKRLSKYLFPDIFHFIASIKGINEDYTSQFLAGVGDPTKFYSYRAMAKYCGVGGTSKNSKNKELVKYNRKCRYVLYKITVSLLMSGNGKYRKVYDRYKEVKSEDDSKTKSHINYLAHRKMAYHFVRDVWREANNPTYGGI